MNDLNSANILDYMKTIGVTTSSVLDGNFSKLEEPSPKYVETVLRLINHRQTCSDFEKITKSSDQGNIYLKKDTKQVERNKIKMKVNQLTCAGCIHSNVCKYKESMEKLQEGIKTFVGNLSPEEEKESGCNINITCNYFSNGFSTVTLPWNPIVNTPVDISCLKDVTPIQTHINPSIGDPVFGNPYEPASTTAEKAVSYNCGNANIKTSCTEKDVSFTPTASDLISLSGKMQLSKDDFYSLVNMYKADAINDQKLKDRVGFVMNTIARHGGCINIESFDWDSYFNEISYSTEFLV